MSRMFTTWMTAGAVLALAVLVHAADAPKGLDQTGKPDIKSAGPLTFGPDGVLFVGDPKGAALFAIAVPSPKTEGISALKIEGIDGKIAGLLGIKAADILINDMAVQPKTGMVYLSVSRGRGPDAEPVIVSINAKGDVVPLALEKVPYAKVAIKNAPSADAKDRRGQPTRLESITDLAYVDGKIYMAGLSNEEFASTMRILPFPFTSADTSTAVEIYHGAHGAFETRAPVRTFTPIVFGGEPHLLAAYTCTPLVKLPISDLKAGAKVRGTTIAELGNRNRPLDIIAYEKGGKQHLLLANSARGVMKIATDNIEKQEGITTKIADKAGLGYETVAGLTGVEHLDKLDDTSAVLLVKANSGNYNLETVELP